MLWNRLCNKYCLINLKIKGERLKRIIKKIRNVFITIGVFLISRAKGVLAVKPIDYIPNPSIQTDYGVYSYGRQTIRVFGNVLKIIIIPIAFVIGAITYYKKSTSSTKRKIITLLISLILIIALWFGIDYILSM